MDILSNYKKEIDSFCEKKKIKKLSLFGSYSRDAATTTSDVDLLVEFLEDTEYSLLDVARMERELSLIIGKKVDLRTIEELSHYFRDSVVKEARIKYEA